MKYCVEYHKHFQNSAKEFDEIIIEYKGNEIEMIEFLKEHLDQRVIINVPTEYEQNPSNKMLNVFKAFYEVSKNIAIKFECVEKEWSKIMTENKIPFFYSYVSRDWDSFRGLIAEGVSDIYIGEDLCFDLDNVRKIAEGITLRTYPNIAQSSWRETPAIKKFFIRPEDVEVYEKYIDVLEFFGRPDRQSTYLKIYKKDKEWAGDLNEIILHFDDSFDSRFVHKEFASRRAICQKRCQKGGACRLCDRIVSLSNTIKDIVVGEDKEEN